MRVLVLGANGRTGSLVLSEALSRNHTITALVRRPDALFAQPNVSIQTGTPLSRSDIKKAFTAAPPSDPIKAVISTLNTGRTSDNPWAKTTAPDDMMAHSVRNALAVMREHGVKKMIVLGTTGVGSSRDTSGWLKNFIVDHSNLKITFDDHFEVEKLLEQEAKSDPEFKWVDVRATGLDNGAKKPVKEFGNDGKGVAMFVSRKSVAGFMVDALEQGKWDGQTPVISN